jgi:hypothetical protein
MFKLTPLSYEQYFQFYTPPTPPASLTLWLKPISGSAKYAHLSSIDLLIAGILSIRSADSLFKSKTLLSYVDLTKFLIGDDVSSISI